MIRFFIVAISSILIAGSGFADEKMSGNFLLGQKEFKKCKSCHMIKSEDGIVVVKGGKVGPNLYGIFSRKVASVDGFKYGASLKEVGETGLVWEEEQFVTYVQNPTLWLRKVLVNKKAKSKMSFKLKKEAAVRNIWAYLSSVSP